MRYNMLEVPSLLIRNWGSRRLVWLTPRCIQVPSFNVNIVLLRLTVLLFLFFGLLPFACFNATNLVAC